MALDTDEIQKDEKWKHSVSCNGLGAASLILFIKIVVDMSTVGLQNPSLIASVIALLVIFGLYDFSKRTGKHKAPVLCALSISLLIISYRAEMTGGMSSPQLVWLPVIPIFGFYILSRPQSFFILALSLLSLTSIGMGFLGQFINTNYPVPPFFTRMFTIAIIMIIASVVTLIYESRRKLMVIDLADEKVKMANASKLADLGEMASSIAHEINNPLTVILARSNNLTKNMNSEVPDLSKMKKECEQIKRMSERIARIVKSMKALSNDHKRMESAYQTFSNLFEDIMILTENKMKLMNIEFKYSNEVENLDVDIFPMQLGQVFLNIINNACDAIEDMEGKWIEVRIQEYDNNKLLFSFIDSGSGIPKDKRNLLFTPFYSSKEIGRGTGLGLSVSKNIVESFGGVFRLNTNCPNTCFEIVLPRKFTIEKVA